MAIAFEDSRRALEQQLSTKLDIVHVVLLIFLTILVTWSIQGEINLYRTSDKGSLRTQNEATTLRSEVWATIKHSSLALGMVVVKGQVLLKLDDTTAQLSLDKLKDELASNLHQQHILLGQQQLNEQKFQLLDAYLLGEIEQLKNQLHHSRKVVATQKAIQKGYQSLSATSAVATMDLLRQDLEVVKAESISQSLSLTLANKTQQLPRNQQEKALVISQINSQLSTLVNSQEQLNRAITSAQIELAKYTIIANLTGEVVQLQPLPEGNKLEVGQKLAVISAGSDWLIHSQFDAADAIGHIKSGQLARVLVDGFPWRQHGSLTAVVNHVAKEGIEGKVEVLLKLNGRQDTDIPLTFGQPLTIEVQTETLSPFMLLLNTVDRAMRRTTGNTHAS